MKSIFSAHLVPLTLAATLLASYAAFILGFPMWLSQFAGFKIEMPAPTIWSIRLVSFMASPLGLLSCGILLIALALLLANRDKFAWGIGLALTLIFGEAQLSLLLPIIAISNSVGGPAISSPTVQIITTLGVALVPPLIFLALRRPFWQAQPPQTPPSLTRNVTSGV